jgi:hypothetical protein
MRRTAVILALFARSALAQPADGGASISVQVEPNGDTTLDVRRGDLQVRSSGTQTRVGAGETVQAKRGKPLQRLLPPATALAPADGATVGTLAVGLSWQPVPGAARYLVEIASEPDFLAARTETVTATRTQLRLDVAATYYWRVVAIDRDGRPGKRGPARRLTIDTTPPKLKAGKPQWR